MSDKEKEILYALSDFDSYLEFYYHEYSDKDYWVTFNVESRKFKKKIIFFLNLLFIINIYFEINFLKINILLIKFFYKIIFN